MHGWLQAQHGVRPEHVGDHAFGVTVEMPVVVVGVAVDVIADRHQRHRLRPLQQRPVGRIGLGMHADHEQCRRHLLGLQHVEDVGGAVQRTVVEGEVNGAVSGERRRCDEQQELQKETKRHPRHPIATTAGRHARSGLSSLLAACSTAGNSG